MTRTTGGSGTTHMVLSSTMAVSSLCSGGSRRPRPLAGDGAAAIVRTVAALALVQVLRVAAADAGCSSNLTAGFVQVELPEGNFVVQSPYDVAENQRYTYDVATGVRTFWVYADDKPFNTVTATNPRTEVRLAGHDYSSGVWQFEAYGYVPAGTSGVSVMQIHNEDAGARATTMMLHVYNGTLRYYSGAAVEEGIYDRWFRLNVVHDVGASTVDLYVDGERRLNAAVAPTASHYFKFGVYVQHHDVSPRVEARWRNVSVYTKPY